MSKHFTIAIAFLKAFFLVSQLAHADVILTGISIFSTDSTGKHERLNWWHTDGSDPGVTYNLYATVPNTGELGDFINTGDGASTSIQLNVSEGTYSFYLFAEPGIRQPHFGANLFFNNELNPRLSAFAPMHILQGVEPPPFEVNSAIQTLGLDGETIVPAADSLEFEMDGKFIQLKEFSWSDSSIYSLDRVSPFAEVPSGMFDFVGVVRLDVASVPEPSSLLILGFSGISCFLFRVHRSKSDVQV